MRRELFVWWVSLQPPARIPKDFDFISETSYSRLLRTDIDAGDWGELYRGSTNGLYRVIVCMGWWLEAAGKSLDPSFHELVEDVVWVIEILLTLPPLEPEAKKPNSRPNSRRH